MKISDLKPNNKNPRTISDYKLEKLKKSIMKFELMMEARPIVVNRKMEILGGNMRYQALEQLGYTEIPDKWVKIMDFNKKEEKEFIIKDNVGYGEWDYDLLKFDFKTEELSEWGISLPSFEFEYEPNTQPQTNYSDITAEQINKEAERLAQQMIKDKSNIDCICPECGAEFQIDG